MAGSTGKAFTLDEARDFLFTQLRTLERFSAELKATVDQLNGLQPKDEWLDTAQEQLSKGTQFLQQAHNQWERTGERFDSYVSHVRELGDHMALQDLKGLNGQEEAGDDARLVHPELQRFKAEKIAKIVGKYGGSPAFGGLVMPRLDKSQILNATASPAALEIQYSKVENKDAMQLAEVMRFKTAKKEQQSAAWQAEIASRKGEGYIQEQQAKGVALDTPSNKGTPVNADLAEMLAKRHTALEEVEEAQAAASTAQKAGAATITGELGAKFAHFQQLQRAESSGDGAPSTPSTAAPPGSSTPLTNELTQALFRRNKAAAADGDETPGLVTPVGPSHRPDTPTDTPSSTGTAPWQSVTLQPRGGRALPGMAQPSAGAATPELLARFQRMKQQDDE